jgi:hypothetical protein
MATPTREIEMESQPVVKPVKNGWHALSRGLGVWGRTREEALARYEEAVARNAEIGARPDPWGSVATGQG